jgi:hypothetical protein
MSTTAKARPRLAQESVGHEVMIKAWYGSNPPHQTLNCRQPRRNPRKPWSGYGPLVSVAGRLFDETLRRALSSIITFTASSSVVQMAMLSRSANKSH